MGFHQTVVRRLRVKGRKLDPLNAQLRLDNLLQTTDLHPAWLPPSAIVCLRQVRDPLPRALNLQSRTRTNSLTWQKAITAAVEEKIGSAVRPLDSPVNAQDSAVIFKDPAELLACLAMDWMEDRLGTRWWWRSLFKGQDAASIVSDAWANAPQYVPAALAILASKGRVKPFAQTLSAERARALLREVTCSFALQELRSALDTGLEQSSSGAGADKTSAARFRNPTGASSPDGSPWRSLVPESLDQMLGVERMCLIGVALTIRRAPVLARSSVFARATLSWLRAAGADEIIRIADSSQSQRARAVPLEEDVQLEYRESVLLSQSTGTAGRPAARESFVTEPAAVQPGARRPAAQKESSCDAPSPHSQSSRESSTSSDLNSTGGSVRRLEAASRHQTGATVIDNPETIAAELPHAPSSSGKEMSFSSFEEESFRTESQLLPLEDVQVETEFGGIFYLINLGLFLELYVDFTAPAGKSLSLSIFDFVSLIGRRLLNGRIRDDPVWELLAQLAGRSAIDPPGNGFEPSDEWRLPAQWLDAFPEERRFEWTTDDERLQVRHPAGFLVLDVMLSDTPARQLQRDMKIYNASAKRQNSPRSSRFSRNSNSLEQWLDWIMPYVRVRLCRALGMSDASDPALLLGAQRASILLSGMHLNIFFALSEHPLEIRRAGLDRDPGWVPAAGRFVRFHYQ